jgi:hypothetical protein
MQPRLPIQHEAEDQDNLAAARKLVLLVQNRHSIAFDDLSCPLASTHRRVLTSYQGILRSS